MVVRTAIATAAMLPNRALHAIARSPSFRAMHRLLACALCGPRRGRPARYRGGARRASDCDHPSMASGEDTARLLGRVALFADLSERDLAELSQVAVPRSWLSGEV